MNKQSYISILIEVLGFDFAIRICRHFTVLHNSEPFKKSAKTKTAVIINRVTSASSNEQINAGFWKKRFFKMGVTYQFLKTRQES